MTVIGQLRQDVHRWQLELQSGGLRGTLLQGIAGKAANGFEVALRMAAEHFVSIHGRGSSFDAALGKDSARATMGEIIQGLDRLNRQLTADVRAGLEDGAQLLQNRRLLSPQLKRDLYRVIDLRNALHHRQDEFARDFVALEENSKLLLSQVKEALDDAFFELAMQEPTEAEDRP